MPAGILNQFWHIVFNDELFVEIAWDRGRDSGVEGHV